ncbi:MAG: Lar family restriction alleviation protein [Oscillospiraceae bacterium]
MSKEIKCCPCCGYEAVIETMKVRKGWEAVIHCNSCLLSLLTITYDTEQEAEDSAIHDWNLRVEPANEPLTLEQVKAIDNMPLYEVQIHGREEWVFRRNGGLADMYGDWTADEDIEWDNYGRLWWLFCHKPKEQLIDE